MEREQTKQIVKEIKTIYQNRFAIDDPKALIDSWHRFLKDYEFSEIMGNLENYVSNNKFAPTVSDIIKPQKEERDRYIPSVEETRAYLEKEKKNREEVANDPEVAEAREKALAAIRKELGIKRDAE